MNACPWRDAYVAKPPIWQFVIFPAEPVYCRATPHDFLPCFRKPVSSITSTASSSCKCSTAYSHTTSRSASASQRSRPSSSCCRQGPGSPTTSERIQPVLRGSSLSKPSKKKQAFDAG